MLNQKLIIASDIDTAIKSQLMINQLCGLKVKRSKKN